MPQPALLAAFTSLEDPRRRAGQRHSQALCLALFTLAIAAGNRGFLAIGDWLKSYREPLLDWFQPPKGRLPSYSTIRRVLLNVDEQAYSQCLSEFFQIHPEAGETLALDGKTLKGSYLREDDNPHCEPHRAIMLVSAYLVERGLILPAYEVESKTNEITVLPKFIEQLALKGVVCAFDAINTQKNLSADCRKRQRVSGCPERESTEAIRGRQRALCAGAGVLRVE